MLGNQVALRSFFQKLVEMKNKKNFSIKKPFVTPNFCCQNFFELLFLIFELFVTRYSIPFTIDKLKMP